MRLRGTEALTLEVGASLPSSRAREMVPARFAVPSAEGGDARGSLLFFRMTGLAMDGLPFPSFDYGEALWRISVRLSSADDALAWFAVACDIDNPIVRALGARLVRYPTRAAKDHRERSEVEGRCARAQSLRCGCRCDTHAASHVRRFGSRSNDCACRSNDCACRLNGCACRSNDCACRSNGCACRSNDCACRSNGCACRLNDCACRSNDCACR